MTEKTRPWPLDVVRLVRSTMRGSAVDRRRSLLAAAPRLVGTPADSPLRLRDVERSPVYGDLTTARIGVGDMAADIDLPLLDQSSGGDAPSGARFRLADHRGRRPVALVFGSYT